MKRNLLFRFLLIAFVAVGSIMLLSYVHARTAQPEEPDSNECGKPHGESRSGKAKTEFILWEALTHNLLVAR